MNSTSNNEHQSAAPTAEQIVQGNPVSQKMTKSKNKYRPKNRTVPKDHIEGGIRWAEPLKNPPPMQKLGLDDNQMKTPVLKVELKKVLPNTIIDPFCQITEQVSKRTNLTNNEALFLSDQLRSQAHFKACKQLYSTLTDIEKTELQPLKAVFYDNALIPKMASAVLAMIGHFETKFGKAEIEHAPLLFKRWLAQGLALDPSIVDDRPDELTTDTALNLVWRDVASKRYIDDKARKRIEQLHNEVYTIRIGNRDIQASPPPLTENLEEYYTSISNEFGCHEELKDLTALLLQTRYSWLRENDLPHNRPLPRTLAHIGAILATDQMQERDLRTLFEMTQRTYTTHTIPHLNRYFDMAEPPSLGQGFTAQLVKQDGIEGHWKLPLSDPDKHLGYTFDPNENTTFDSHYKGISKRAADENAAYIASQSLTKNIKE